MPGCPQGVSRPRARRGLVVALLVLVVGTVDPVPAGTISAAPPVQPASGPGAAVYRWAGVASERVGSAPDGAWLLTPAGATAAELAAMPVIVFLHGFTATDPERYWAWLDHLVRQGAVLVYPDYQESGLSFLDQDEVVPNMLDGIVGALQAAGLAPPTVHVVGHSLGGVLGVAYLDAAPAAGLPEVATLTVIAPGGCATCGGVPVGVDLPASLDVPPELLLHIVTGADDSLVGDRDAQAIAAILGDVPGERRRLVEVQSDRHGEPDLVADHLFPQTGGPGGEIDALDWYGLWRPFDALLTCATSGQWCDIALGTDASALAMGHWSDGTPVTTPSPPDWS